MQHIISKMHPDFYFYYLLASWILDMNVKTFLKTILIDNYIESNNIYFFVKKNEAEYDITLKLRFQLDKPVQASVNLVRQCTTLNTLQKKS